MKTLRDVYRNYQHILNENIKRDIDDVDSKSITASSDTKAFDKLEFIYKKLFDFKDEYFNTGYDWGNHNEANFYKGELGINVYKSWSSNDFGYLQILFGQFFDNWSYDGKEYLSDYDVRKFLCEIPIEYADFIFENFIQTNLSTCSLAWRYKGNLPAFLYDLKHKIVKIILGKFHLTNQGENNISLAIIQAKNKEYLGFSERLKHDLEKREKPFLWKYEKEKPHFYFGIKSYSIEDMPPGLQEIIKNYLCKIISENMEGAIKYTDMEIF